MNALHQADFAGSALSDRRDGRQPEDRLMGRVIACDGARATLLATIDPDDPPADFWSIGKLVTINIVSRRIVGLVYELAAASPEWNEGARLSMHARVELVGEIVDGEDGAVSFRRGITSYPYIGALAHRIRARDLAAVYDLGARGGTEIGWLSQDASVPATVCVEDMLSCHFAVVGTTGVGKSSAVSLLLRKSVEANRRLRVLILDPHNEYATAFPDTSIVLDASSLELPFWMFNFEEMTDVIFRGRVVVQEEHDILRELIVTAKSRYRAQQEGGSAGSSLLRRPIEGGPFTADMPVPYRIADLVKIIDEMLGQLEPRYPRPHLRSLKARLESLFFDPRYRFMFNKTTIDDNIDGVISRIFRIPHMGRPITVFQLAGLPADVTNSVASVLARMAFDLAAWSNGGYEILLLCEEAHRYVPLDRSLGFAPTRLAIARIAKEGRKYGAYLGIVTQRPGELDPTILSQCSTVFAMRLGNDRDQEIIRSAIADSSASTISFLSSIGNREAIAFGEGVATPMRMTFQRQDSRYLPGTPLHGRQQEGDGISLREIVGRMRSAETPETRGY